MRFSPVLLLVALVTPAISACDGDDDCQVVCEKNAECQADAPAVDDCVAICEELSADEGYAEALAEQADCIEEEHCDAIANGACAPDFS